MAESNDVVTFRKLLAAYSTTSRSDAIRLALGQLIETLYSSGLIDRAEYHSSMEYIR